MWGTVRGCSRWRILLGPRSRTRAPAVRRDGPFCRGRRWRVRCSCGDSRCDKLADHLRVDVYGVEKIFFGDVLVGGVCDVDAAGADEEGLSPRAIEDGNVRSESDYGGGKALERLQVDRFAVMHFAGVDAARGEALNNFANGGGIAYGAEHDFGAGFVGDYVWRAAAG